MLKAVTYYFKRFVAVTLAVTIINHSESPVQTTI